MIGVHSQGGGGTLKFGAFKALNHNNIAFSTVKMPKRFCSNNPRSITAEVYFSTLMLINVSGKI